MPYDSATSAQLICISYLSHSCLQCSWRFRTSPACWRSQILSSKSRRRATLHLTLASFIFSLLPLFPLCRFPLLSKSHIFFSLLFATIMAPQPPAPLAATVLGTIGATFWCIQLLPQIYFSYRLKNTEGLPAVMMVLWAVSSIPFGTYAIVQKYAVPLQIQPQIFCVLSLVCWGQILRYQK